MEMEIDDDSLLMLHWILEPIFVDDPPRLCIGSKLDNLPKR